MPSPRWVRPLRYPGGKARMADALAEVFLSQFGLLNVEVWVEPFAGGAGAGLHLLEARCRRCRWRAAGPTAGSAAVGLPGPGAFSEAPSEQNYRPAQDIEEDGGAPRHVEAFEREEHQDRCNDHDGDTDGASTLQDLLTSDLRVCICHGGNLLYGLCDAGAGRPGRGVREYFLAYRCFTSQSASALMPTTVAAPATSARIGM